jgi:dihydroorotase
MLNKVLLSIADIDYENGDDFISDMQKVWNKTVETIERSIILVKGGNVPGVSTRTADILIENGIISSISEKIPETSDMVILDASGLVVVPGLVDMHVHFRDPGYEYKEDILTGAAAAACGGVTTCCCMPNTSPVADNAKTIEYIVNKAKKAPVRVLPYGAVTVGQKGRELTDFAALKAAGAVALSDDGCPVQSAGLMRRAMLLARENNLLIISHCEDAGMVMDYAVNEGAMSRKLGIPGRPAIAEEIMVARDAMLAAETGAKVHIAHVSTAGSVEIIRKAKATGAGITAETCPQYFSLTEDEVLRQGALARVNPPLRTKDDVAAIIRGLADGTIDAIATDHAPHSSDEKAMSLTKAPSGMIGLETSLALTLKFLYHTGELNLDKIIALMSANPAGILGINAGTLEEGSIADIVIFDADEKWTVYPDQFKSKARNTPFAHMSLRGKVKHTIAGGKII